MELTVLKYPNPILNQKSRKITRIDDSIKALAHDLAETMQEYQSDHEIGVALAAIQVGVPIRMTVIKQDDGSYITLLNPKVVKTGKEELMEIEGCISVPKKYGPVKRFKKVKVKGIDLNGRPLEIKAEGLLAQVLQHEIDHMNGKLFISKVKEGEIYKLSSEGKLVK